MSKSYNYMDILLALREEYKKQNRSLVQLKGLTDTSARKVSDFHYWINKWVAIVNPELMCRVTCKNGVSNYTQDTILLKSNNDEFYFQKDLGLDIDKKKKEQFNYLANEVLASDVANKMYSDVVKANNTRSYYSMMIKPSEIRTVITNGIITGTYINYSSYLDRLSVVNFPEKLDSDLLLYLLSLDFDVDQMPDYISEIVINNAKDDKKVILPKYLSQKKATEFSIDDSENEVRLKRM